MMDTRTQGHWDQVVGRLRERWAEISEDELLGFEGNAQQLVGFIELRTADARDEIEKYVHNVLDESGAPEGHSGMDRVAQITQAYTQASRQAAMRAYQQASRGVHDGYVHAGEMVRRQPVGSIAVAFGTGLVAGVMAAMVLRSR